MELGQILASHRVVVVLGSGGVGKTTTSAAIALDAAMRGKRALCLTIDPARRLANSLGLDELGHAPQRIDPARLAAEGLEVPGELSAMMLDMKHTFDDLVDRYASSPEQRARILGNRIYQYVSTSLAGTQEYMAMEKLHAVREQGDWDLVVLDTPPTTNALDFLDAPQKLVGAIDSPVMRWFVQQLADRKGVGLFGKGAAYVLRGLARFTGVEFLEQVGQFITDLNALFGGFRERAQAVYDDLRGPEVAFLIVTSPSPLSVAEAVFFSKKLDEYGISPSGVVVNRIHAAPELGDDADALEPALLSPWVDDPDARTSLLERMRQAAATTAALGERDREGVRRLRQHVGETMSYTEVPALDRDVHDLEALATVRAFLSSAPA